MLKLTWNRAAAWRARRHHLDRRAPAGSMLAVASRLCGFHAQVLSSAELTAWASVEGLTRGAVRRALWDDRTLVKTWAMRGTLHVLPSAELPLWRAALDSRVLTREELMHEVTRITGSATFGSKLAQAVGARSSSLRCSPVVSATARVSASESALRAPIPG
jgi:hypothetical protein